MKRIWRIEFTIMSLLSIIKNKDIIEKEIELISEKIKNKASSHVVGIILSKCLVNQYEMKLNYLNKNMLRKRFFDPKTKPIDVKDSIYQHIYMHTHIGMEDEIYETEDAIDKYFKNPNLNNNLLILEEFIDIFHFIMDTTINLEEHSLYNLFPENIFEVGKLDELFTGHNSKTMTTRNMLKEEGFHISSDIFCNTCELNIAGANDNSIKILNSLNREFVRRTNFKDWKKYSIDEFFSPAKFAELFSINRKMYVALFNGISQYISGINELFDYKYDFRFENIADIVVVIYIIYISKREENIRRQINDPRYTGKNDGEIVGIDLN